MDNQLDAAESRKIALTKVRLMVHEMKEKIETSDSIPKQESISQTPKPLLPMQER